MTRRAPDQFVFAYGSLLGAQAQAPAAAGLVPARLAGFRRRWNVAMDNRLDLPGYKYYRDPAGARPPLFVTFLNLAEVADAHTSGVIFRVRPGDLDALDRRERNYRRVEVTERVQMWDGAVVGRAQTVWTYLGTSAARERFELGAAVGRAAVHRAYHDSVLRGFAGLGETGLAEYVATTDEPGCPIIELERIELPAWDRQPRRQARR